MAAKNGICNEVEEITKQLYGLLLKYDIVHIM